MIKIKVTLFTLLLGLLLFRCANQQMPPGGPKDTTPPEIVYIYPQNGTLNFSDNYFEIEFSEYVDELSLLDALFISPEIKNIDYDWSGTSVKITFDDTLSENTTYTVSIGSGIKDLNNQNPMTDAVNFTFSTGDKIDVGKISGQVYDENLTGTMIFAYLKIDTFANPVFEKPMNVTQVGENGKFELLGLKNGEYRLFAVKDKNGNRLYNIGEDGYGVAPEIVILDDSASSVRGINFKLTKEDTISPFISNVTMTDKYHLSVEYSEFLDSTKLNASNFYVIDTTDNQTTDVKFLYQGNKRKVEYFLVVADTLDMEGKYFLIAENICDKYNNVTPYESYEFIVNDKPDTLIPKIKKISTPFEKDKIDYLNPNFTILFDDGIDEAELEYALQMDKYNWEIEKINDALFRVNILSKLNANEKIEFKINRKIITDAAGNRIDSVQSFTLNTLSGREFSGLSGTVDFADDISNMVVVIDNCDLKEIEYSTKVDANKEYNFERILPGKYTIWMFDDRDDNGKYNYGKVFPFELSEKFFVYPDTLNLRPRWPVGDVLLNAE